MTRKVDLGAPSLTGKDANDLVAQAFADAIFPLKLVVTNHMPRDCVFPEVGLHLKHCSNEEERGTTVEITSADQLQRFASSVEQIAELNGYPLALTIEDEPIANATDSTDSTESAAQEPVAETAAAEAGATQSAETETSAPADAAQEPVAETAQKPAKQGKK